MSPGPTNIVPRGLEVVEGVGGGGARAVAEHGPAGAVGQLPGPRRPAGVVLVQERGAAGGGQQERAEPDEAACGRLEGDDGAAGVAGAQVEHAALAGREGLGDGAHVLVGHVAHAALEGLVAAAVDLLGDHLGPAHLQLVALPPHRLDEHGELELAPAGHLDHVGRCRSPRAGSRRCRAPRGRGARGGAGTSGTGRPCPPAGWC